MDYTMPGLPVLHNLLESAQTHVLWASDAIQKVYEINLLIIKQIINMVMSLSMPGLNDTDINSIALLKRMRT